MLFIRRSICALLLACGVAHVAHAQGSLSAIDLRTIQQMEDSLNTTADSMYAAFLPDTRIAYSERFARQLVRALRVPNSWSYDFPKVSKRINIIPSGDGAFRLFNWDIAPTEETRRYYGAIQMPGSDLKLYGLVDYSAEMSKGSEDSILTRGKWLGALYYRIIPGDIEGKRVYTLFGLNAAGRLSNRKVLEPLQITPSGPVFGAPIFNVVSQTNPNARVNRFILEYKKDVQVKMNWDEENRRIFFDNLVSQVNDPARKYTYVPSGQVDGFKWDGSSWNYMQDIVSIVPRRDGEAPINEPR
jgi:hypothetical protein